jgi:hypothetical protein
MDKYPGQTFGFRDVSTDEYSAIISNAQFIWIPIAKQSLYMKGTFTSTLSVGLGFRKILIMPRYLSELYHLAGVVLEYEKSINEIDFDNIDRDGILARLDKWMYARTIQNSLNFMTCFLTTCD